MGYKKILLVDDSNTILLIEKMILARDEYHLLTAGSGEEAVAKAVSERPDLILMDAVMPGMDGLAACRELRRMEETRDIPIILVTTRGEDESLADRLESGCSDHVTKPINAAELLAKVQNLLR